VGSALGAGKTGASTPLSLASLAASADVSGVDSPCVSSGDEPPHPQARTSAPQALSVAENT
jgi:hypothetical protein